LRVYLILVRSKRRGGQGTWLVRTKELKYHFREHKRELHGVQIRTRAKRTRGKRLCRQNQFLTNLGKLGKCHIKEQKKQDRVLFPKLTRMNGKNAWGPRRWGKKGWWETTVREI